MYPRLKLARNLLSDDGAIFISIDENEVDNLKKLCNEIFGEINYRNQILVRRRIKSLNLQFSDNGLNSFNVGDEYIFVYSKSSKFLFEPLRMKKKNASKKGKWNVFWSNADRPTMRYDILEEIGVGKGKISKIYSRLICQDEYLKLEKAGKIIKNETVLNLDDLYNIDIFKKHKDNNTKESKEITVIKKGIFDRILNVIKKIFKR